MEKDDVPKAFRRRTYLLRIAEALIRKVYCCPLALPTTFHSSDFVVTFHTVDASKVTMIRYAFAFTFVVSIAAYHAAETGSSAQPQATSGAREYTQESETSRGIKWGYSVFLLVNERNVQAELQLTAEQTVVIGNLADELVDSLRRFARENRERADGTSGLRTSDRINERTLALLAHYGTAVMRVLNGEQQRRLDQVAFQLCGFEVLRYREVMDALKLSNAQASQITGIRNWLVAECKNAHAEYVQKRHDASGFNEAVDRLLVDARTRTYAILTSEQRQWFVSMEGPRIGFGRRHLKMEIRKPGAASSRNEGER